jgi:hypothetical protein
MGLGRAARDSVHNIAKLEKQAAAVAERITIPSGVEFVQFDHGGKTYAISVRLLVEVDRVPNVVADEAEAWALMPTPPGRQARPPARELPGHAHDFDPGADACHRKCGRVMRNAEADPAPNPLRLS